MLRTELMLFGGIIISFAAGWAFSLYLHREYWMSKQTTMGIIPKMIFITELALIGVLYSSIIYQVFRDGSNDKTTIILRFIILFASNMVLFALLYFILYLFNNQEYGKTDENVVIASTLQGRYIQMLYFSIVTFFTVGYSNLIPFGTLSRVFSFIQILTAYSISAYLYSRSGLLFNIK